MGSLVEKEIRTKKAVDVSSREVHVGEQEVELCPRRGVKKKRSWFIMNKLRIR